MRFVLRIALFLQEVVELPKNKVPLNERVFFHLPNGEDITRSGGLWDESGKIYPLAGGVPNASRHSWTFSGGKVTFGGLQYETDLESWRGAQICMLGFDQLETFTYQQFLYLMSRNRSTCGVKPYVRATCNPEPGWLADFLDWWLADDGYAELSHVGKKRWFIMQDEQIVWGDTRDEMTERFPDIMPRSCTFIPSTIYDNQILLEKDPNYLANLQGLSLVDRDSRAAKSKKQLFCSICKANRCSSASLKRLTPSPNHSNNLSADSA